MPVSTQRPRIIPVMDIRGGVVVRAIAGRREEYKPIVSRLTDSTNPLVVAEALRQAAGTDELYVADLDAIQGGSRATALFAELSSRKFRLWVDAGIRVATHAKPLVRAGVQVVIAASETLKGPNELRKLVTYVGADRLAYSHDLRNGIPISAADISGQLIDLMVGGPASWGVRRAIVLDIGRIGLARGTGTETLCARTKQRFPDLELVAGGGVRGPEDLPALAEAGVDAVLVASALHDGKFGLPESAL